MPYKQGWETLVIYYKQYLEAIRDAVREEFRMQSESE